MIGMLPEVVSSKCVTAVLQKTHHRAPLLCFSCVYVLNSSFSAIFLLPRVTWWTESLMWCGRFACGWRWLTHQTMSDPWSWFLKKHAQSLLIGPVSGLLETNPRLSSFYTISLYLPFYSVGFSSSSVPFTVEEEEEEEELISLFSFFHFILRFWNQILICRSVRQRACAISIRRRRVRYRLKWNSFSSSRVW